MKLFDTRIIDAAKRVSEAIDNLIRLELDTKDPNAYTRIEALARFNRSLGQKYAQRVAEVTKAPYFDPGPDGGFLPAIGATMHMDDDESEDGGVRLVAAHDRPVGDMAQVLRESLMMLQNATDQKLKSPPTVELQRVLDIIESLKAQDLDFEASKLKPYLNELITRISSDTKAALKE